MGEPQQERVGLKQHQGASEAAGKALEAAGSASEGLGRVSKEQEGLKGAVGPQRSRFRRASEGAGRASKGAGRASKGAGRASEGAGKASDGA